MLELILAALMLHSGVATYYAEEQFGGQPLYCDQFVTDKRLVYDRNLTDWAAFDIGWYEQKAVAVLLALLHLGVKGIRLGPTLPAFLSPTVANVLVENFDIKPTGDVQADVDAMMSAA